MNNAVHLDDLAGLLRLHTGLEGLARDIGPGDPTVAGHVGHLRKIFA